MPKDIVIIHGWGSSIKSFGEFAKFLIDKGHQVHIFDLPGFGEAPAPENPWSVADYANFVLHFSQSQGLDNFYLFGHSFGGRIAIKFAALHQEKLAGLILCDSAGVTPRSGFKTGISFIISQLGSAIFSLPLLRWLREPARHMLYFVLRAGDYYHLETEAMRETFKKVINEDLTSYLSQIKAPTLIVWGRKDKETPISDAHKIHEHISGSRLEILEGVGHSPHLETPERLGEIVDKFIRLK